MTEPNPTTIAILIDAENVLPSFAELIFTTAEGMGTVVAKEIYGVAAALTTWVEPVLRYAIHPNLTIKASKGKNTSDIALVIGAMDVLLKNDVNTVVIASSDSDFSGLSVRLRTAGINVIGMGTEKSNPLWRTACSSFVVLEHPAPAAQPARQSQQSRQQSKQQPRQPQQQPQQAQPAKAQQPQQPAQPAASAEHAPQQSQPKPAQSTHKDRVAMIQQIILKRLASNGGRVQANTLFTVLNRVPEYRMDRQGSGKKPLNYLTSTFSDVFNFEDSEDGKVWVTVKGLDRAEPVPADEVEAPAVEAAEAPVAEPAAEAVEAPEAEPVQETVEDEPSEAEVISEAAEAPEAIEEPEAAVEAPEAEPEPEQEPEADTPEPEPDEAVSAFVQRMIEDGFEAEIAENIARILAESDNLRQAYNTLRKVYGNDTGRDYYNRAKEILAGQQ